jgi:hypothetical protein
MGHLLSTSQEFYASRTMLTWGTLLALKRVSGFLSGQCCILSGMDVHRRGKKWKPCGFMECVYELDKRLGR